MVGVHDGLFQKVVFPNTEGWWGAGLAWCVDGCEPASPLSSELELLLGRLRRRLAKPKNCPGNGCNQNMA